MPAESKTESRSLRVFHTPGHVIEETDLGWRISDEGGGCHMANWHELALIGEILRLKDEAQRSEISSRDSIIEECAKAIEPANHPLLMSAAKAIRALKNAAPQANPVRQEPSLATSPEPAVAAFNPTAAWPFPKGRRP